MADVCLCDRVAEGHEYKTIKFEIRISQLYSL